MTSGEVVLVRRNEEDVDCITNRHYDPILDRGMALGRRGRAESGAPKQELPTVKYSALDCTRLDSRSIKQSLSLFRYTVGQLFKRGVFVESKQTDEVISRDAYRPGSPAPVIAAMTDF